MPNHEGIQFILHKYNNEIISVETTITNKELLVIVDSQVLIQICYFNDVTAGDILHARELFVAKKGVTFFIYKTSRIKFKYRSLLFIFLYSLVSKYKYVIGSFYLYNIHIVSCTIYIDFSLLFLIYFQQTSPSITTRSRER